MTNAVPLDESAFLVRLLEQNYRIDERRLILADFYERALTGSADDRALVDAICETGLVRSTHTSCRYLVNVYLERLREKLSKAPVDLLVVCPKGLELRALQIVFEVDADNPSEVIDGFHFFDGKFESTAAQRPVSFSLVCLGGQTNVRAAREVERLLRYRPCRMAALIGMAAGIVGVVELGDVVMAEQVIYITPGTIRDDGQVLEPEAYSVDDRIVREVSNAWPERAGWHASLEAGVEEARNLGLELPKTPNLSPKLKLKVILSDERKDESSGLAARAAKIHGDSGALEMESGGFAAVCKAVGIPWVVVRGIADHGQLYDLDGTPTPRTKEWQVAATLAAGYAFRCWAFNQLYYLREF